MSENEMQTWTGVADRTNWPAGPWDSEPDKAHWKDAATSMDCLAVRNRHRGNWCGYVAVTEAHPAFGRDYSEVDAVVHGGLTFADFCQETGSPGEGICHVPYPGDPDRVWWLGFDCAHAWDYSPDDLRRSEQGGIWGLSFDQSYKSLGYVQMHCRQLAAQLAEQHSFGAYEVAP